VLSVKPGTGLFCEFLASFRTCRALRFERQRSAAFLPTVDPGVFSRLATIQRGRMRATNQQQQQRSAQPRTEPRDQVCCGRGQLRCHPRPLRMARRPAARGGFRSHEMDRRDGTAPPTRPRVTPIERVSEGVGE